MGFFTQKPKIIEEALTFQSELTHLLEEPLPRGIRGTIYWCLLMVAIALGVAIVFKVDVVVQGPGKLTYDSPPVVVQTLERSVLRSLHVRPGDHVKKGDVLASIDPTFSGSDLTALEDRKRVLRAQAKRMEAEAQGLAYEPDPADGKSGTLQLEIFQQRQTEYQTRVRSYEETLAESKAALSRTRAEQANLQEQLTISSEIEQMQRELNANKTNSKLEYLAAQSARLRAQRESKDATDRIVELEHRIETAQAQRDSFKQEWRRNILEELNRIRSEETQVDSQLAKTHKISSFTELRANEDGMVVDIAARSVGSVVRDGEVLVSMIPSAAPLLCEIELSSGQVGDVKIGDPVLIKVDAYTYQKYGGLTGKIRSISHTSYPVGGAPGDPESAVSKRNVTSGGMHRVIVELVTTRMEALPSDRNLFPGMTVSGEVHIGRRRIINYILYPLLRGLRESFREA